MTYQIKITYQTGNSFGSHDEEAYIELEWQNLNRAKESLQRIKNHYKIWKRTGGCCRPEGVLPEGVSWDVEYKYIKLELVTDTGKPYLTSAFWTGYFERLHEAEIVLIDSDSDMKITYN